MKEVFIIKDVENVQYNVNMGKHSTFKTGGNVKVLYTPKTLASLKDAIEVIKTNNIKNFVIGNGSNVLFSEEEFDGVVIKIGKDFEVEKNENKSVEKNQNLSNEITKNGDSYSVKSGVMLAKFANTVCRDGYTGIEFGTGVPGSVGGAVYMNAGCYGREIVDCVTKVLALNKSTLDLREFTKEECELSYRNSFFQNNEYIIISADFVFEKGNQEEINSKVEEYRKQRTEKQPINLPSAGSTFKRPLNDFAGRLIEEAGLKGFSVGGAEVSTKHAGFVVNKGNATPTDIIDLINEVKKRVLEKTGVTLELEIKVI